MLKPGKAPKDLNAGVGKERLSFAHRKRNEGGEKGDTQTEATGDPRGMKPPPTEHLKKTEKPAPNKQENGTSVGNGGRQGLEINPGTKREMGGSCGGKKKWPGVNLHKHKGGGATD